MVAPVYDDAEAACLLLAQLRDVFAPTDVRITALLVDDGSPSPVASELNSPLGVKARVLRLRRNVGHQRAIALGTAYVHEHIPCDAMLVMDADGEDRPADAVRLLERCRALKGSSVVFAERTRRSESALFLMLYRCYQFLHWLLTGIRVRVGNFCVVPQGAIPALVTLPALWNHFAAAIFHAKLPRDLVPTERGTRYSGKSKMNFVSLFVHGLQAISVFIEIVAVRLLLTISLLLVAFNIPMMTALCVKSGVTTPSWLPWMVMGFGAVSITLILFCFLLTLGLLAQRNSLDFIPVRDYHYFVDGVETLPEKS